MYVKLKQLVLYISLVALIVIMGSGGRTTAQTDVELDDIERITDIELNPNGDVLAIGGNVAGSYGIWFYQIATDDIDSIITEDVILSLSWSSNGQYIAGYVNIGNATTVQVFDVVTKQLLIAFEQPPTPTFQIAWDTDSTNIATAADSIIYVRNMNTGNLLSSLSISQTSIGTINDFAWDTSGSQRLYGLNGFDKRLFVWNAMTGELIQQFDIPFVSEAFALSNDNNMLAIGGPEGYITILDAATGDVIQTIQNSEDGFISQLAWHPDNNHLATRGGADIRVWDVNSGKQINTFPAERNFIWDNDGGQLILASLKSDGASDIQFLEFQR